MDAQELRSDLRAEQDALDHALTAGTGPGTERDLEEAMAVPTASPGWCVAHQIAHLTWFDRAAARAISDAGAFEEERDRLVASLTADPGAIDALTIGDPLDRGAAALLDEWREGRAELDSAAAGLAGDERIPWFGPSMSARSFLTARLMEVWAHGQDVVDALDLATLRPPTDRLRHIAHLGVVTRGWSHAVRGAEPPGQDVRVELTAPSGTTWQWGDADSPDRIRGPAEDFCLVVTQRRHVDDTALECTPGAARHWMEIAQAFAGGPTTGPPPRAR